jgi:hypothetical protein
MKLFKANAPAPSEEDRARDLRLTSIASRYRVRPEFGHKIVSEPEPDTSEPSDEQP